MDHFTFKNGVLHAEDVPLTAIAEAVGTPVYVYSRATLTRHARVFRDALRILPRFHIAFAIKANPNLAVLKLLAKEGYGADVVSGGEMERALAAGMPAADMVFSGVGKSAAEMVRALEAGIGQFNLESEEEGVELAALAAARGLTAQAALRVNPDVDAGTHGKISTGKAENKFGVPYDRAGGIYARLAALPGLHMRGLAVHIGSQLAKLEPLESRLRQNGRTDARGARRKATASPTWTSAAGSACLTRRARSSPARRNTRRWSPGVTRGLGRHADVRAGPGDRRQFRRAGDPGDPGEAGGVLPVRHRRCGDERSRPPGDLRCLARFRRGAAHRASG